MDNPIYDFPIDKVLEALGSRMESKLEIKEVKPVWSYFIKKYAESRKIQI